MGERWAGVESRDPFDRLSPKDIPCRYYFRVKTHPPGACVPYRTRMHLWNVPWCNLELDRLASPTVIAVSKRHGEARDWCGGIVAAVVAPLLQGRFPFHGFDQEEESRVRYR